ncbi:MAG: lytic transglycosylase domain-containing protein [Terriglobales bacterium]
MKRSAYILAGLLAVIAYLVYNYMQGGVVNSAVGSVIGFVSGSFPADWLTRGADYVPYINQIEQQYGLPQNYLAAVAYQESNFQPGAVNAGSNATGMFQLLPQYYPNAGASWQADAATSAQALAGYYRQFGDWQVALAAYNWGPGNVSKWINAGEPAGQLPTETSNYIGRIASALTLQGGLYNV